MKIAVIGGGPAGIFAALSAKESAPEAEVTVFEKTSRLLAKVKLSGGGRCNVTHACFDTDELSGFYPRGGRFLKKAFHTFSSQNTVEWFKARGVELKTEKDNRMFPVTDDSQTIIDCLLTGIRAAGVIVKTETVIDNVAKEGEVFRLETGQKETGFDRVILAAGGLKNLERISWLFRAGHTIEPPLPSLFSFNIPEPGLNELTGLSVPSAIIRVQGEKLAAEGPLLITHWGLSGPAILKLSSFGARTLAATEYKFRLGVNWTGISSEEQLREKLKEFTEINSSKMAITFNPFGFAGRLWEFLLARADLESDKKWIASGKKEFNRLVHTLMNDEYAVAGKTTFKDEFVTCGGIKLNEIDVNTMGSRLVPGLYFAGEVIDVDGLTGGFNFQNAWTTGYIAGKSAAK